jgi:hypothetical protein
VVVLAADVAPDVSADGRASVDPGFQADHEHQAQGPVTPVSQRA